MNSKKLNLENTEIKNFDPYMLNKGQEMIFTLKDTNVLDNEENNIKDNLQIDEIKYDKNTGISIERYNENERLEIQKEKNDYELQADDGQIIGEDIILNKINKINNKIEKQNLNKKKKFQEEFYNEEELKLLNKKKNRQKKGQMILFDIDMDMGDDEKKEENINKKNNDNKIDNNIDNTKKSIFTSEDKEKLESLFNIKKKYKDTKVKKNIINIDENISDGNNHNNENDNIRINTSKNCKILDDYAIFLDKLPSPKNNEESKKLEKDEIIEAQKENNNNNEMNEDKKEKEENDKRENDEEKEDNEDDYTFKQDDEIPLISDEPIIGKGVCVALQIFKNKKMLKKEEEFGRYHDKKYENITNGGNEENVNEYDNNTLNIKDKNEYYKHKEINIEYRDENGRKLRPKEMARYQALIFHGSQSSVRKREKKLLREKYQVFVQNPTNNKTLNYMNFMKDKNQQAFATIQGKSSFL